MRPILSYNYGAKEYKRVKKIYNISLLLILGIMFFGMILCLVIPNQLLGMFTDNPETIKAGVIALRIISIGFIVSAFSIAASGALEALGKGLNSLIISLLRYVLIIIPLAFLLSLPFGVNGVWNAFWITELITAVIAYIIYNKSVNNQLI